ncbi:putative chemoreceptor glutamine deamidase CheD [Gammaproteobacteria bacterium]
MTDEGIQHLAPNLYLDRQFNCQAAKILPGEYYVTSRDMVLVTVLGSCIAACIRDPVLCIGGMNHFMLPESGGDPDSVLSLSARYGAYAMELLINHLLKMGASRSRLEAKVFGAGRVLAGVTDVGARNTAFVLQYLDRERIRLLASDLGGVYPRKVYFFPDTGRVLVRELRTLHNNTLINRERAYSHAIDTVPIGGGAELF